jgi:hypothetical protein
MRTGGTYTWDSGVQMVITVDVEPWVHILAVPQACRGPFPAQLATVLVSPL